MADVNFVLTANNQQLIAALQQAQAEYLALQRSADEAGYHIDNAVARIKNMAMSWASMSGLAVGGFALFNQIRDVSSELQNTSAQFRVFLKSAEAADAFMKRLSSYAYNNVFEFKDLAQGSAQLLAYGTKTDEVITKLNRLSEVAAGTNKPIGEMVQLFNRVKSSDVIDSRTNIMLKNAGIDVRNLLGLSDNVRLKFKDLDEALKVATEDGGMYAGMMAAKMETSISDAQGQLQDSITQMLGAIGDKMQPIMKKMFVGTSELADEVTDLFSDQEALDDLIEKLKVVVELIGLTKAAFMIKDAVDNAAAQMDLKKQQEIANQMAEMEKNLKKEDLRKNIVVELNDGKGLDEINSQLDKLKKNRDEAVKSKDLAEQEIAMGNGNQEIRATKKTATRDIKEYDVEIAKLEEMKQKRQELVDMENEEMLQEQVRNGTLSKAQAEEMLLQSQKAAVQYDTNRQTLTALDEQAKGYEELISLKAKDSGDENIQNLQKEVEGRMALVDADNAQIASTEKNINVLSDKIAQAEAEGNVENSKLLRMQKQSQMDELVTEQAKRLSDVEELETAVKERNAAVTAAQTNNVSLNAAAAKQNATMKQISTVAETQNTLAKNTNILATTSQNFVTKAYAVTLGVLKGAVTQVTMSLKAMMASNPVGLILMVVSGIGMLGKAVYDYCTRETEAEKQQHKLNDAMAEANGQALSEKSRLDSLRGSIIANREAMEEMAKNGDTTSDAYKSREKAAESYKKQLQSQFSQYDSYLNNEEYLNDVIYGQGKAYDYLANSIRNAAMERAKMAYEGDLDNQIMDNTKALFSSMQETFADADFSAEEQGAAQSIMSQFIQENGTALQEESEKIYESYKQQGLSLSKEDAMKKAMNKVAESQNNSQVKGIMDKLGSGTNGFMGRDNEMASEAIDYLESTNPLLEQKKGIENNQAGYFNTTGQEEHTQDNRKSATRSALGLTSQVEDAEKELKAIQNGSRLVEEPEKAIKDLQEQIKNAKSSYKELMGFDMMTGTTNSAKPENEKAINAELEKRNTIQQNIAKARTSNDKDALKKAEAELKASDEQLINLGDVEKAESDLAAAKEASMKADDAAAEAEAAYQSALLGSDEKAKESAKAVMDAKKQEQEASSQALEKAKADVQAAEENFEKLNGKSFHISFDDAKKSLTEVNTQIEEIRVQMQNGWTPELQSQLEDLQGQQKVYQNIVNAGKTEYLYGQSIDSLLKTKHEMERKITELKTKQGGLTAAEAQNLKDYNEKLQQADKTLKVLGYDENALLNEQANIQKMYIGVVKDASVKRQKEYELERKNIARQYKDDPRMKVLKLKEASIKFKLDMENISRQFAQWRAEQQKEHLKVVLDVQKSALDAALESATDYVSKQAAKKAVRENRDSQVRVDNNKAMLEDLDKQGISATEYADYKKNGESAMESMGEERYKKMLEVEEAYKQKEQDMLSRNALSDAQEDTKDETDRFVGFLQAKLKAEKEYQDAVKSMREDGSYSADYDAQLQKERTRKIDDAKNLYGDFSDDRSVEIVGELAKKSIGQTKEAIMKLYGEAIDEQRKLNDDLEQEKKETQGELTDLYAKSNLNADSQIQAQNLVAANADIDKQLNNGIDNNGNVLSEDERAKLEAQKVANSEQLKNLGLQADALDLIIKKTAHLLELNGQQTQNTSVINTLISERDEKVGKAMTKEQLKSQLTQKQMSAVADSCDIVAQSARGIGEIFDKQLTKKGKKAIKAVASIASTAGGAIKTIMQLLPQIVAMSTTEQATITGTAMTSAAATKETATTASTAIQQVENASVILAIISAALQVVMAIASALADLFTDTSAQDAYDDQCEKIEDMKEALADIDWETEQKRGTDYYKSMAKGAEEAAAIAEESRKAYDQAAAMEENDDAGKDVDAEEQAQEAKEAWQDAVDDMNERYEELMESLTGTSLEDFTSGIADALIEGFATGIEGADDAWDDFINDMEKTMMKQALTTALQDMFEDSFKKINAMTSNGELTQAEMDAMVDELNSKSAQAKQLAQTYYDLMEERGLNDDEDEEGSEGFGQMTQDTADALNARFTALQMEGANVVAAVQAMQIALTDMQANVQLQGTTMSSLLVNSNLALQYEQDKLDQLMLIAQHTALLVDTNDKLQTIANYTSRL